MNERDRRAPSQSERDWERKGTANNNNNNSRRSSIERRFGTEAVWCSVDSRHSPVVSPVCKKRGRPSTTLQKMAMPTSEQRDQIADPLYEIEYGSSLDAQARAGLALRQWIIGDFAEQVAADPPRAVRLALVTRELMSIVGSASSRLPIVAATLEELGSRPEHRSARKNAAFAVASAWHPFVDEMDVDEIKQKLSWLGEPTTGSLFALRTRLKKVCAARNGHLERNPVPWIAYHGRLDEGSGKKVRSFSFGLEGGGG